MRRSPPKPLTQIKSNDSRPPTGMVGQRCVGYLQDSHGNLIRLVPETRGAEWVGPGSYSPEKNEYHRKGYTISGNIRRRNDWISTAKHGVSPVDHQSIDEFRTSQAIRHKIKTRDFIKEQDNTIAPFLEHKPWISSRDPKSLPKRRFPRTKFQKDRSPAFANQEDRVLFQNPDLVSELPPAPRITEEPDIPYQGPNDQSPCFKRDMSVDQSCYSGTPSPSHYIIPPPVDRRVGISFKKQFVPDPTFEPEPEIPGPGAYDQLFGVSHKPMGTSPVFANQIERATDDSTISPPPDQYQRAVTTLGGPKVTIQKRTTPHSSKWYYTGIEENPIGRYNIDRSIGKKGVAFKRAKRDVYGIHPDDDEDRYTHLHDGFIKKSHNSNYYSSHLMWPRN